MDAEKLIEGIWDSLDTYSNKGEKDEFRKAMIKKLEDCGYYVCYGDSELREKALAETDLVEPRDDED